MIVSMWVRSYWLADYFFFDPDGEYAAQVVTTRGVLHVHFRGGWLLPSSGAELPDYRPSGTFSHLAERPAIDSSLLLADRWWVERNFLERMGFRYDYLFSFGLPRGKGWQFPLWFVCVIAALLPLKSMNSLARRRWRRKHGLCAFCGYDRRATSGVCPECGKEAVA
jgi:hypothetical protein